MLLNEAIDILKEFVRIDRGIRETKDCSNDFDNFCEEKCTAIETLINIVNERRSHDQ